MITREIKEIDTTYIRLVVDNSKAIKEQEKAKARKTRKIKNTSEKVFAYITLFATYLSIAYMIFLG